jgi:PAS domain S-box-containing protein
MMLARSHVNFGIATASVAGSIWRSQSHSEVIANPISQREGFNSAKLPSTDARLNMYGVKWLDTGILCVDQEGIVVSANSELKQWLECDDLAGSTLSDVATALHPAWGKVLQKLFESEQTFEKEELLIAPDSLNGTFQIERTRIGGFQQFRLGNVVSARYSSNLFGHEEFEDRPATRAILARVLRAEAHLESLGRRWPGVIFSQRADFSFSFVSEKIEQITGISPEQWRRSPDCFWQVVHEADLVHLQQQIKKLGGTGQAFTNSYRVRHALTGRVHYILEHREAITSSNGLVLGYEGVWLDITRQTIAENRLRSASWKETLAVITMGLAHDFSNMMAGIHSLVENFQEQVDQNHPFQEGFALIRRNSMQATQLVQRILNLHQGKVGDRNYHNLNDLVSDTCDVLRKTLPRRIELKFEPASAELALYLDAVEFRQVIINMALNAADSMPRGGVLTITTSLHDQLPTPDHWVGAVPKNPVVCLSIKDTGTGIKQKHLDAIFDPFFTTKASNKGSGLGLYNARLCLEKHGGGISVTSSEGKGTEFGMWLPRADFSESERSFNEPRSKRPAILVVEENGARGAATVTLLRQHGYYAACANDESTAQEYLSSADYLFEAVMVLTNAATGTSSRVLELARQQKLPLKTIVQVCGANPDEIETSFLVKADLTLSAEITAEEMVQKLDILLKSPER